MSHSPQTDDSSDLLSKHPFTSKIMTRSDALTKRDAWKTEEKTVVFTNGCFDLLHAGHVTYLSQAKQLGDKLIIGLNTDDSVKTNKGPKRPLVSEEHRAFILSAMELVDGVVFFNEKTPELLISEIKPDIHVKGGDYKAEDLPEYKIVKKYGGDVKILPFVDGLSTSRIIAKILSE